MKSHIHKTITLIAALILLYSCSKKQDESPAVRPDFSFKIQTVLGDVNISTAGVSRSASAGETVAMNEIITTGKNSIADLTYGTSGVIRISANSKISISSIVDKTSNSTTIDMENGKILLTLSKLKGTGFNVKTNTIAAAVRGTSFLVESGKKGSRLLVLKGKVNLNPVKDGKTIEDKTTAVEKGMKTDYITEKNVESIVLGKTVMNAPVKITDSEIALIKAEVREMKIDSIQGLDPEVTEEVNQNILEDSAIELKNKEVNESPIKKHDNSAELQKKKSEEEATLKQEEERKRLEEVQKAKEEQIQKEEKIKKDRASNIPTM